VQYYSNVAGGARGVDALDAGKATQEGVLRGLYWRLRLALGGGGGARGAQLAGITGCTRSSSLGPKKTAG